MSNGFAEAKRGGIADVLTAPRARQTAGVLTFTLLTALGAYAEVRLPGLVVPVTLQTLVVSLAGVLLGARLGAISQTMYLLAGALGAPVFAGGAAGIGHLMGPTGGYLLAFPLAAAVTGWLTAGALTAPGVLNVLRVGLGILLGTGVIFVGGAAQLALLVGDPVRAVQVGVLPFLLGDVLKTVAATMIARRFGSRARSLF